MDTWSDMSCATALAWMGLSRSMAATAAVVGIRSTPRRGLWERRKRGTGIGAAIGD